MERVEARVKDATGRRGARRAGERGRAEGAEGSSEDDVARRPAAPPTVELKGGRETTTYLAYAKEESRWGARQPSLLSNHGAAPPGPASNCAPPWWDENVGIEFTESQVFDPEFVNSLGTIGYVDAPMKGESDSPDDFGFTAFLGAVVTADIPAMRAVLRRGARIDAVTKGASCLPALCLCRNFN